MTERNTCGKHSPGPWTTDHVCFDARIPIRGGVTAYGRPYVIAHVNRPGSSYSGQSEANARLIAAAPDLLEALTSMVVVYAMNNAEPVELRDTLRRQIAEASAAIAKATGASQ